MDKEIDKLHRAYWKAEGAMVAKRDKLYPGGTVVIAPYIGMAVTVKSGSLYADQVNTSVGHMAWANLEIVKGQENGQD